MFKRINQINYISSKHYQSLIKNSTTLKQRRNQPAVLLSENDFIVKYIYRRNIFSSSTIWPYALRFQKNAKKLLQKGFIVPEVKNIFYYPVLKCHIIIYPLIPGVLLIDFLKSAQLEDMQQFCLFILKLHRMGILFRDCHLSNFIKVQNDFALLDLHSVQFYKKELTPAHRAKNILRMFNKAEHKEFWTIQNKKQFLNFYLANHNFSEKDLKQFLSKIYA